MELFVLLAQPGIAVQPLPSPSIGVGGVLGYISAAVVLIGVVREFWIAYKKQKSDENKQASDDQQKKDERADKAFLSRIEGLEAAVKEHREEKATIRKEKVEVEARLLDCEKDRAELHGKHEEVCDRVTALETVASKVPALEESVRVVTKRQEDCEGERGSLRTENASLKSENESLKKRIQKYGTPEPHE